MDYILSDCCYCQQDSDVQAEATRVLSGATNGDDAIIMKNLVKVFIE